MNEHPDQPSHKSARSNSTCFQHREVFTDDRHIALIEVSKWALWRTAFDLSGNQASDIVPLLDGDLRGAGQWPSVSHHGRDITDDEHTGHIREIHERTNRYPPRS